MRHHCAHLGIKFSKSLFYHAIFRLRLVDVNLNSISLELFAYFYSRVLSAGVVSQRIVLVFFFLVFVFFKNGMTFPVKYYFAFVKIDHFCFVSKSCMRIQFLEPP